MTIDPLSDVLQAKEDEFLDAKVPMQLAIAGRPNVGKSTLVNTLLKQERVLTGPEPGLTRDSVRVEFDYQGQKVRLVSAKQSVHPSNENVQSGQSAACQIL